MLLSASSEKPLNCTYYAHRTFQIEIIALKSRKFQRNSQIFDFRFCRKSASAWRKTDQMEVFRQADEKIHISVIEIVRLRYYNIT